MRFRQMIGDVTQRMPGGFENAGEMPAELPDGSIRIEAATSADGWRIDAFISAAALPGWDPLELPRLGFFAAIVDRRLGRIPFCGPPEFPWECDPTTWAEMELLDSPSRRDG